MQKVLYASSGVKIREIVGRGLQEKFKPENIEFSFANEMIGIVDIIEEGEVDSLLIQGRLGDIDKYLDMMTKKTQFERFRRKSEDGFYPAYGPADMKLIIEETCRQAQKPIPRICFGMVPEDFSNSQIETAYKVGGCRIINVNERTTKDRYAGIHKLERWIVPDKRLAIADADPSIAGIINSCVVDPPEGPVELAGVDTQIAYGIGGLLAKLGTTIKKKENYPTHLIIGDLYLTDRDRELIENMKKEGIVVDPKDFEFIPKGIAKAVRAISEARGFKPPKMCVYTTGARYKLPNSKDSEPKEQEDELKNIGVQYYSKMSSKDFRDMMSKWLFDREPQPAHPAVPIGDEPR